MYFRFAKIDGKKFFNFEIHTVKNYVQYAVVLITIVNCLIQLFVFLRSALDECKLEK